MTRRARNDWRQYDDLSPQWWERGGDFAALHWIAAARARLLPPPRRGAVLVDMACGGGLMAPYAVGYRHVGVDLSMRSLGVAAAHGVFAARADVTALPLRDECADVVVAGEIFEHVADVAGTVAEAVRVLRPGGTVICDTINDTRWARFSLVTVGERLRGGPPPGCHDPALFVPPQRLRSLFAAHGLDLRIRGLGPAPLQYVAFLARRRQHVDMVPVRSTAALYQGVARKPVDGAS